MSTLAQDLADLLKTVERPGDFHVSGSSEIFAPTISIAGLGVIALPLLPAQATQLIGLAERAPYGRGEETLVDTAVRRTWQIDAQKIHISGRHWAKSLDDILNRCARGLGVHGAVAAELYKLLVYDTGSFFVGHRDTEKAPGMFATLVVVLPSPHTGGELRVRHQGREVCLDLSSQDPAEVAFAAFYADCWHEVRPVESGSRLALIYNLIHAGPGRLPEPPTYHTQVEALAAMLGAWATAEAGEARPEKLIYPLEHIYTPAEIGFARLKNADAAVAAVLLAAARQAHCELHLALVSIEESGSAEEIYYRTPRRYGASADDQNYEIGEVFERTLTLSEWRTPDAGPTPLPPLPFAETELCPPDIFEDALPDEQQFFEATGNEGASFERTYRRAALILWPEARKLNVIAAAGRELSLPYLADLVARWQHGGEAPDSPLWHAAHRLAGLIVSRWPAAPAPSWISREHPLGPFLESLCRLRDREAILSLLSRVSAKGDYRSADNPALMEALGLLPPLQAAESISQIIAGNAAPQTAACADLLRLTVEPLQAQRNQAITLSLQAAAADLVAALPGPAAPGSAPRPVPPTPELVADLLRALYRLETLELGTQAVGHILSHPGLYTPDGLLVPAALPLAAEPAAVREWPPIRELSAAAGKHLARRIAEALEPPADWSRPRRLSCQCASCTQLATFLADPGQRRWIFKAAEALRSHVAQTIRNARCDVDTETLRHSRPYELACTKNQASFERRVAQRQADLRNLAVLQGKT